MAARKKATKRKATKKKATKKKATKKKATKKKAAKKKATKKKATQEEGDQEEGCQEEALGRRPPRRRPPEEGRSPEALDRKLSDSEWAFISWKVIGTPAWDDLAGVSFVWALDRLPASSAIARAPALPIARCRDASEDPWHALRSKTAWRRSRTASTWFGWPSIRAKQLKKGARPLLTSEDNKEIVMSLREIAAGS